MMEKLSPISEEGSKTILTAAVGVTEASRVIEEEGESSLHYIRHVDSETEGSESESDTESVSSSSSSSDGEVVKRRRPRKRRDRSLSRKATRRRRGNVSSSPDKSRTRYYDTTDSDTTSRSRTRRRSSSSSQGSSSRSSSRSPYRRRPSKSGKKKKGSKSYNRDRYRSENRSKRSSMSRGVPRTPNYWPRNAVNNYSTTHVNNSVTHSQLLISSPRNFSTNDVRMGLRRRLQVFLDDPNSSKYAVSFALFIAFMVMISSIGIIIESLPQFYDHESKIWSNFELITLVIFTSELALRCFAHSTSLKQFNRFFWSFSNFIDIIAIAPVLFEALLTSSEGRKETKRFMVFRLFRLIRLLHCYGYSSVLQLSMDAMFIALKKSKDALLAILFFQFFVIIIFSTLIYFFERGTMDQIDKKFKAIDGEPSKFDSIPATFWFVAEVITTVGLGDVYPKTVPGKLLSFPLMLFGLLIIALPSIVLGKNFAEAWLWLKTSGNIHKQAVIQAKLQKEQRDREREKSKKKSATLTDGKKSSKSKIVVSVPVTAKDFAKGFEDGPIDSNNVNHLGVPKIPQPPEYYTAIEMDRMEKGGDEEGEKGNLDLDETDDPRNNEDVNNETVRSSDQQYFVSTEALLESENQSEILQLVQMLVEQFQQNTQVIERLARQQDNLVGSVALLKQTQLRMMKSGAVTGGISEVSEDERESGARGRTRSRSMRSKSRSMRSRSRSRSRTRSRNRERSRDRNRSRSQSRDRDGDISSSRGRSRSKSNSQFTHTFSPRKSSRSRSRSRSDSSGSRRRHHRRRVSSCSTCEIRTEREKREL